VVSVSESVSVSVSVSESVSVSVSVFESISVSVSAAEVSVSVSVSVSESVVVSVSQSVSVSVSVSAAEVSVSVSVSESVSVSVSVSESISVSVSVSESVSVSVSVSVSEVVVTTTSIDNGDDPETTRVEINIPVDVDGRNIHWYFADHDEWHLDGIEVTVGGEAQEVSLEDFTFTVNDEECETPGDAYDGKTFNYEVTVVYKDYVDQPATFDAKIGQRGDANLDHKVKANDCAYIAKDLAQKATGKTTITKEDGFGIFLGNADGKVDPKWKIKIYQPYCLDVTDAAKIAQFLARVRGEKSLTLYDVVVLKK
jgi:hypothetical protein